MMTCSLWPKLFRIKLDSHASHTWFWNHHGFGEPTLCVEPCILLRHPENEPSTPSLSFLWWGQLQKPMRALLQIRCKLVGAVVSRETKAGLVWICFVRTSFQAMELAKSAIALVHKFGGRIPSNHLLCRISSIGNNGLRPSNAERDLHVVMKTRALNADIEFVNVRMWDPKGCHVIHTRLPVIMPDSMARAMWHVGEKLFKHIFIGDEMDPTMYWDHLHATSAWFRGHPCAALPRAKLIPLSLYGDEVDTYRNSEVGTVECLGFSSDLCHRHGPLSRYMLLTCYSEHTASDHTYRDLMAVVNARIIRMCDPEIFDPDEYPWQACGYRFMFSSVQGDLKWLNEKHGMHPWRQNRFCTWCHVVKSGSADPSMTAGDFRPTAAHLRTYVSTQEYLRLTPAHERNLSLWHVNKTKSLDRCIIELIALDNLSLF